MSKVKTFKYTKTTGKVSERTVVVLNSASKHDFTIDISELNEEQQAIFAVRIAALDAERTAALSALMQEFDVSNNFRLFDPEKMQDVSEENF